MRPLPLDERRAILKTLPLGLPVARVTPLTGDAPWERACREGWEGVIAKRRDSPYEGKRSKAWLKMECEASQELVVGGFTDPQRSRVGSAPCSSAISMATTSSSPARSAPASTTRCCANCARASTRWSGRPRRSRARRGAEAARPLGDAGDRRPGGVHGVDGRRQAAASTAARRPHGQGGARRRTRASMTPAPADRRRHHPSREGPLPGGRDHQGRGRGLLPGRRPGDAPAPPGPAGHHGALPLRHRRKGFLQKDVVRGFPEWLQRVELPKKDGAVRHPLATDTRSLVWMANQNAVTLHVWTSRMPAPTQPDVCVFDLDPAEDDPESRGTRRSGARPARRARAGTAVKTSGSKGFHVVVPLKRTRSTRWPLRRHRAELIARHPERLTQEFRRPTGADASSSTSAATGSARPWPRPTRCGRGRVRRCRRRARGRRWSAARWVRALSRCGRWWSGSTRWATCGRPVPPRRDAALALGLTAGCVGVDRRRGAAARTRAIRRARRPAAPAW